MRRALAFLLAVTLAAPGLACLWDYDTLQMERQRFPGALELIVGKFLRHSDTFYEWRVRDRRGKMAAHESGKAKLSDEQLARAYDDLAVALDKLGKHGAAIAAIREKAQRLPKVGEYETHANLGTFLVHSGRLEEGAAELKKAIEINPDAHFGREKYHVLLVEYVIERRRANGGAGLPLDDADRSNGRNTPFATWLLKRQGPMDEEWRIADGQAASEELAAAGRGVLGMMRFGDFRSPVLLEAAGDLLLRQGNGQLAARAYLRAAETVESAESRKAYRKLAEESLSMQKAEDRHTDLTLASVEDQLRREVREADDWFKRVAYDEELWVEKSPDPDAKFWGKYGDQDIRVGHDRLPAGQYALNGLPRPVIVALALGAMATVGVLVGAVAWRRRRPTGYDVAERQGAGRA